MQDLYLITGFLGAGKTTFMNQTFSIFKDKKIAIIVNEFGKQGVDGALLAKQGYEVTEISNGSIFCVCRMDKFIETLGAAAKTQADIILVETSGLSNPTNIGEVIETTQKVTGKGFYYKGCITLVDAKNFTKVAQTAVVVPDQIRQASLIVVNKVDLVEPSTLIDIERLIRELNPACEMVYTTYSKVPYELVEKIQPRSEQVLGGKVDLFSTQLTVYIEDRPAVEQIRMLLEHLKQYLYRCKGYVETQEGICFIDGVMEDISITAVSNAETFGLVFLFRASNPVKKILKRMSEELKLQLSYA